MGGNAKIIKRRIKSVANTRKITKAMELVSASKMRKAINSVLGTRPFAQLSWNTINAISKAVDEISHPLLNENPDAKKDLIILFSSDRGLAGAFNSNMLKKTVAHIKELKGKEIEIEVISIGKKGNAAMNRNGVTVISNFEGLSNKPTFEEILPIGTQIIEEYSNGKYKNVYICYTDFISALVQTPRILQLLPLGSPEDTKELGELNEAKEDLKITEAKEYKFEPNPQKVLDRILPRLVETMLYQALLESSASEHSARMMAMRNATESAGEMLSDLKFTYNRIRQAGITQEIAEISSGKAALE